MMGHRFQHCMPPRMMLCPPEDFVRFKDAVTSFYVRQDELLGPILKAADAGATVLVVSDHGFKTGDARSAEVLPFTTQQPVEWHREEGVFILSGPGARRGYTLAQPATLFDIAPTILYLLGMPLSTEMPGHALMDAIDPTFRGAHAVRTIPSYETVGGARVPVASVGPGAREAEEDLLASLRALGYIGGDNAGPGGTESAAQVAGPPTSQLDAEAGTQVFYHRNLATYLLKRKEYGRAAEQLLLANERQKLPKTYQMLSEAYLGMGKKEEALAILDQALSAIDSMDPESVLWIVQICLSGTGGSARAETEARRFAGRTATKRGLDDAIAGLMKENAGDARGAGGAQRAAARAHGAPDGRPARTAPGGRHARRADAVARRQHGDRAARVPPLRAPDGALVQDQRLVTRP